MCWQLSNGVTIPEIGLGTWNLQGEACIRTVKEAVAMGYRLIDTASFYRNEEEIGQAIQGMDRSSLFLASKCWKDEMGYEKTLAAFKASCRRLGTEYLDLYMIHWPSEDPQVNVESWQALIDLYKQSRVRAIGVSNFTPEDLMPLLDMEIIPMTNEILFHPGNKQRPVRAFCREHHIQIIAYQPLGRGAVLENHLIKSLAEKYGVSGAQICLAWEQKEGAVPIPKSSHLERLKENLETDIPLTEEEIVQIDSLPPMGV